MDKVMEDTVTILKNAKDWLSDPQHWCRGQLWQWSKITGTLERTCLIGATTIQVASKRSRIASVSFISSKNAHELLDKAALDLYERLPARVNDELGYDAAMKVLDLAISRS